MNEDCQILKTSVGATRLMLEYAKRMMESGRKVVYVSIEKDFGDVSTESNK